jgi:hypothetical protein
MRRANVLVTLIAFLFIGNLSFSQTLILKYTSSIDFNTFALQFGRAFYLSPSFIGLQMCSFDGGGSAEINKSRFVVFDLKGNTKWTWNAGSYGVYDFWVEASTSGSFWIRGYNSSDPIGMLMIYNKKTKTWSEASVGQDDSVDFDAIGQINTSALCTVTKNESGTLTFYVYKY